MKKQYTIQKSGRGYMHYIELDAALAKRLSAGNNRRVVCTLDNSLTIHAALMKTKEGMHYLMIGGKYLRELGLKTGSRVSAQIRVDTSTLQFHIPEEFSEVMATDPEAQRIFDTLTDGNKRGLIALVNMVKSTDKKIERALRIADKLKRGIHSPQKVMK